MNDTGTETNSQVRHFDIIIYGGTAAGIAAAIQAAKMGKRAAVIEPTGRVGGLSSGGLGDTDFGDKGVIGGISREFYARLGAKYGQEEPAWFFEPRRALEVFQDWIEEYGLTVFYRERLDLRNGVNKAGNRILSIRMESGITLQADVFIDTSYEGDLMAQAGVSYATGRESNAVYREVYNGIQTANAGKNQLPMGIDPYVVKGDPTSGLLPQVNPDPGGADGEGDHRIQAYCYRMCLTNRAENRILIEKPEGYDEEQYELLFRALEAGEKVVFKLRGVPNGKTDSNNDKGFSTDFIGANYDYPEADYAARERISKEHERYQRGLVWTVQNHPRVPADVQQFYKPWGLPLDEFVENGHWTPQLYIREARRMVGVSVMTEHHIMNREPVRDPIGMGSYTMDSHNVQRYVDANGFVRNEGDVQVRTNGPYSISYHAIVPREEECANLLVPVCLSSSHIAYGSIRMEPVFMVLGQSASTAAVLALESGRSVQAINLEKLAKRLKQDGQVLANN